MTGLHSLRILSRVTGLAVLGAIACLRPALGNTAVSAQSARSPKLSIVAAETFYGSMVQQLGGSRVSVVSLLDNPNADPHQFEASPRTAGQVSAARLVVKNGIGYDAWVDKILSASPRSRRVVISVGELLGHHQGDNPHVWYDPSGWTREAHSFTDALTKLAPGDASYFRTQQTRYLTSLQPVRKEIAQLRHRVHGMQVTATEPVFGYMATALGLQMRNIDFQKAVMDGTDPAPQAVGRIESDLKSHRVHLLIYNSQATSPITLRIRTLAEQQHIPVVGVSELAPRNSAFQQWQLDQLKNIDRVLR